MKRCTLFFTMLFMFQQSTSTFAASAYFRSYTPFSASTTTTTPETPTTPETNGGTFSISGPSSVTKRAGEQVYEAFTASNGTEPYSWIQDGNALPSGIYLTTDGILTGASSADGTYSGIDILAFDSAGNTASTSLSVNILPHVTIDMSPHLVSTRVGNAVSISATTANIIGTPSFSLNGSIPSGLSFDVSNGSISGSPTSPSTTTATVTLTDAYDGDAATSSAVSFSIYDDLSATGTFDLVANAHDDFSLISFSPSASGVVGTATWSLVSGSLPSGIFVDASTGRLYGSTSQTGVFSNVVIGVTDAWDNKTASTASFTVTVNALDAVVVSGISSLTKRVGSTVSTTFTATGGASPYSFSTTGTALPSGLSLSSAGVLSGAASVAGTTSGTTVVATDKYGATGTTSLSTDIVAMPTLSLSSTTLSGRVGDIVSISATPSNIRGSASYSLASGTLPTGVVQNSTTGSISGTIGSSMTASVVAMVTDAWDGATANAASLSVTTYDALTASGVSNVVTVVNTAMSSFTPTVSGVVGTATWSLSSGSLPSGITVDSSTGKLVGTPTVTGTFTASVKVTDSWDNKTASTASFTVTVTSALVVSYSSPSVGTTGVALTSTASASGGSGTGYTWSISNSSGSSSVGSSTGLVTIDTASAGTKSYTLTVMDSNGLSKTSSVYTTTVANSPSISFSVSSTSTVGASLTSTASASGGSGTGYTWSISNSSGSSSVNSSSGLVKIDTTSAGTKSFTLTVSDSVGRSKTSGSYSVVVSVGVPSKPTNASFVATSGTGTATLATCEVDAAQDSNYSSYMSALWTTGLNYTYYLNTNTYGSNHLGCFEYEWSSPTYIDRFTLRAMPNGYSGYNYSLVLYVQNSSGVWSSVWSASAQTYSSHAATDANQMTFSGQMVQRAVLVLQNTNPTIASVTIEQLRFGTSAGYPTYP